MGTKAAKAPAERPSGIWRAWKAEEAPKRKDHLLGRFLTAHEGFARKVVRGILAANKVGKGMPRDDLLQAARVGLLRAAKLWDPARGRFTTVAWWWIRKEVQQAITDDVPLRGGAGRARPVRVDYEGDAQAAVPADDPTKELRGLAQLLIDDLDDSERDLLLGPDTPEKIALVAELRTTLDDMDW